MKTQYLQDFVDKTRHYKKSLFCLAASCSYLLAGMPQGVAAVTPKQDGPKLRPADANLLARANEMFANCDKSKSLFDRMVEKGKAEYAPFAPVSTRPLFVGTDNCPGTNIPAGTSFADSGTTIGANNTVNQVNAGCTNFTTQHGPDMIYKFVLPALGSRIGTCSITVTPTGGNGYDPSIYVLTQANGGCPGGTGNTAANCIQGQDSGTCNGVDVIPDSEMDAMPAGIYYLFVDSFYAAGDTGTCGVNKHNGNYNLSFICTTLSPTAAIVGVGGRVTTADGRGIGKATVAVTLPSGQSRTVITNPFGFYSFEDIEVGQSYVFQVNSKGHTFSNGSQLITVNDSIENLNFTADAQGKPGR